MLQLSDLTWQEIRQAVADMCEQLNIPGATQNYDLYAAVAREWVKARGGRATEEGGKDDAACEAQPEDDHMIGSRGEPSEKAR